MQIKKFPKICNYVVCSIPIDTGRKLNVHKTFSGRSGRVLNNLYTFNLRPVSTGMLTHWQKNLEDSDDQENPQNAKIFHTKAKVHIWY